MQFLCQQVLAGSVFSGYQHVGISCRHFLHHETKMFHRGRFAPVHSLFAPSDRFRHTAPAIVVRVAEHLRQFTVVPRLFHKVKRAVLHGLHSQLYVGIGGKQHHRHLRKPTQKFPKPKQSLVAVVVTRHKVHVQQHHINRAVGHRLQHPLRRIQSLHLFKNRRKQHLHRNQHIPIVVDHQ